MENTVKSRIPVKVHRSQSVREHSVQRSVSDSVLELNILEIPISTDEPFKMPVPLPHIPGSRPAALIKSASFKETKLPILCNNPDLAASASRFLALRAKYKEGEREERQSKDSLQLFTRLRLQTFPTVMLQKNAGALYTPQWNWIRSLKTAIQDANASAIWELHHKVINAANLLTQIKNDFETGLSEDDEFVRGVCQEMDLVRVGRPRQKPIMSIDMIPYMEDHFNATKEKQQTYAGYLSKPLTSARDIKNRNLTAKWIMQTCQQIGYSVETVHLAVYILDAYSTGNKMCNCPWPLLGITALHIASKVEEPKTLKLSILISYSMHSSNISTKDVSWLENMILKKLRFDLNPPSSAFLASLVIYGGSLKFPTVNMRKLTLDLSLGILYKTLDKYNISLVSPVDKARAALEIAVECIYHQYNFWINRDMSAYTITSSTVPGQAVGEFALEMCTQVFTQRFAKKNNKLSSRVPTITCNSSPGRNLKAQ